MRIDLPLNEAWTALCEQYRAALPYEGSGLQVQVYRGCEHAVWETTRGLAKLFSHRKTVVICTGADPAFESIAVDFSADGYTVKTLSLEQIENTESWLDAIQSDLLFVLLSADDPVSGRVFDFPKLQVALKDKRVFVIRVSHESFRYEASLRPSNYEISVWSLRPDRALMIGGDRCRVAASFVSRLPWRSEAAESVLDDLRQISLTEQTQMKESVTRFETSLLQGFQAFFAADAVRIYDRAVLYHPEFDGSAVIEELSKVLHIEIKGPGEESKLETTSPCRWGSLRLADWMSKQGRTEDQIRGLILLSWDLLTPSLHGTLAGIAQELRKKQTGH